MGFGDVKLGGVLGLYLGWYGWEEAVVGGFAAFILGAVVGVVAIALFGATRKSMIVRPVHAGWGLDRADLGVLAGEPVPGADRAALSAPDRPDRR